MKHLLLPGLLLSFLALPAFSNGPNTDVGTLPNSSAQPSSTRTGKNAVNVEPCSTDDNGGSSAANQCSSEGNITIKANGDVNCSAGVNGVVATGNRNDNVKVGDGSNVAVIAFGSSVVVGAGTSISVTNTHPFANAPVTVDGSTVYVQPGETFSHTTNGPGV